MNCLAVVVWLGMILPASAATVAIADWDPKAVTLGGAQVKITVNVSDIAFSPTDETDPITLSLTGGTIDGGPTLVQGVWSETYPAEFNFFVYDITAELVITVTGSNSDTKTIPLGKITGLNLRMAQDIDLPAIAEANYDQDVYIRAGLNIDPLPLPLNYDSIGWYGANPIAGSSWVKYTAHEPGRPTVYATLGVQSLNRDFWKVKLTLKEIELGGTGFREIKMDTPSTATYTKPHWNVDRGTGSEAYPVLIQINQILKATPRFIKEPSDYPNSVKIKATGGYEMDEQQTSCAGSIFTGLESSANVAVGINVGKETPSLTWQFSVGQSAVTDAGMSTLEIYRALTEAESGFITEVDVACGKGGSDAADVQTRVWGQFSARNVKKYKSEQMTYWKYGAGSVAQTDVEGLIASGDGACGAWGALFQNALAINGITSSLVQMVPTPEVRIWSAHPASDPNATYDTVDDLIGIRVKTTLKGQGGLMLIRNKRLPMATSALKLMICIMTPPMVAQDPMPLCLL